MSEHFPTLHNDEIVRVGRLHGVTVYEIDTVAMAERQRQEVRQRIINNRRSAWQENRNLNESQTSSTTKNISNDSDGSA